jgi:hypothetical protein
VVKATTWAKGAMLLSLLDGSSGGVTLSHRDEPRLARDESGQARVADGEAPVQACGTPYEEWEVPVTPQKARHLVHVKPG